MSSIWKPATQIVFPRVKYVQLRSPKPGNPVTGIFLDSVPLATQVHYSEGRTHPCVAPGASCRYCDANVSMRPQGYIGCITLDMKSTFVLQLSNQSLFGLLALLEKTENSLRGWSFKCYRMGQHKNSRQSVMLDRCYKDHPELPHLNTSTLLENMFAL